MMNKIKLDLKNPIFVLYFNTENMPRSTAEQHLHELKKTFDIYENVTFWIISSNHSAIECIYDGFYNKHEKELINLIKEINKRVDILSKSNSFEDFKINIRDFRLDDILKDEQA